MNDRLAELKSKGGGGGSFGGGAAQMDDIELGFVKEEEAFMGDFFTDVTDINNHMAIIRKKMSEMELAHQRALNAVNQEQMKSTSNELDELMDDANKNASIVRAKLKSMEKDNKIFEKDNATTNPAEVRIRQNMLNTHASKFLALMQEYGEMQGRHKKEYRNRVERQCKIVKPDATADEIDRALENKSSIFAEHILEQPGHAAAKSAYTEIQERHREILRLEQSINELHQLFVDMAILVDAQGNLIDHIEMNISKSVAFTEKGVEEMKKAVKHQKKARKKMCFLIIILLVVAGIALFSIIAAQSKNA
eukprot:GCRY01000195.1.p1 GENE.GCRY01000195.1~~GCRY01000195.1.p1  ORF type:complete len:307 (-),score=82.69 GCRY01000195.1:756-1676(-)